MAHAGTHNRKLRGRESKHKYSEPEVIQLTYTKKNLEKPARITKRQLGPVLALLQRMAAGGDATTAVDAARLVPVLQRAIATAPAGRPRALRRYIVSRGDGTEAVVQGLVAAAAAAGKAKSTLANALTKGGGVATFAALDENGNPAQTVVRKAEEN